MGSHRKDTLILEDGSEVTGSFPQIISASRVTDIPAFYSDWFMDKIIKGYCTWINPFNQKPSYISFEDTKLIVFWTKNPAPLMEHLPTLDALGYKYYFTYTVNDYPEFEHNLPSLDKRIQTFKDLSKLIGKEKVIWRFDPLILTDEISIDNLVDRVFKVAKELNDYTNKLVISFVDIKEYKKVQANMSGINYILWTEELIYEFCDALTKRLAEFDFEIATCSEDINLYKQFKIKHNHCIDLKLINSILGYKLDLDKDSGQRELCGCVNSKDIGMSNTCLHNCVYCYATRSHDLARKNYKFYNKNSLPLIDFSISQ